MLRLPPPIWALVYVLLATAISWLLGWPKMPGFPLPQLGIALVTVPWILPVWAIIMFRREGTEVSPTSDDLTGIAHLEVDVWVILRWFIPNALELAAADAHERHPDFIVKLRITFHLQRAA